MGLPCDRRLISCISTMNSHLGQASIVCAVGVVVRNKIEGFPSSLLGVAGRSELHADNDNGGALKPSWCVKLPRSLTGLVHISRYSDAYTYIHTWYMMRYQGRDSSLQ